MKRIKILLLISLLIAPAFQFKLLAKEKERRERILSVNPGVSFNNDIDYHGFGCELSYQSYLSKRFFLRQNIGSWIIDDLYLDYIDHSSGMDISSEIGYSIFKGQKRSFSLSIGPNIAYAKQHHRDWTEYNDEIKSGNNFYKRVQFAITYQSRVGEFIHLNTRYVLKGDIQGDCSQGLFSIGIGINLNLLGKPKQ